MSCRRTPLGLTPRLSCLALFLSVAAVAWGGDPPLVVTVTVTEAGKRAVPGAQVYVTPIDETWAKPTIVKTDESGAARIASLEAGRRYRLSVEPPYSRGDLTRAWLDEWTPREGTSLDLPPGRTVSGTVVDDQGRLVSCTVHYMIEKGGSGSTTSSGTFEFRSLPAGPVALVAVPASAEMTRPSAEAPWVTLPLESKEVRLSLWTDMPESLARRLEVKVTGPDGTTPAQVVVDAGYWSVHTSTMARSGAATITLVEEQGDAFVRAYAAADANGVRLPWAPTRVDISPGETRVHVRMPEGHTIAGFIRDASGALQEGVRIAARDAGKAWGSFSPLASVRSGPDGSFTLIGLGDGEVDLATEASEAWPASAPVRASGGARDVIVVVRKATELHVRIVDWAGKPVQDAPFVLWHSGRGIGEGRSGADGRIVLPAFDPTLEVSLEVNVPESRDDLAPQRSFPWVPRSGDVAMPRGFTATLRVLDDDGKTVPAEVTRLLSTEKGPGRGGWAPVQGPGADGRYIVRGLPLQATRFSATPRTPSAIFPGRSPWVNVDPEHREAVLRVASRGRPMTIRAEGAVEGQVGLLFAEADTPVTTYLPITFRQDGTAVIESVALGEYGILVPGKLGEAGQSSTGRLDRFRFDGTDVLVPTAPGKRLRIRAKPGTEVDGVFGMVFIVGDVPARLEATADGTLESLELPDGEYDVLLMATTDGGHLRGEGVARPGQVLEVEMRPDGAK